ncbi:unnamed protein product [Caenorhabditis sp. 36 PRJEB53466]|nr:unnamed protein product [Caenorhabditis sp. 36 PRJEB53466]
MGFRCCSWIILWFVANTTYYHVFFRQFPEENIRVGVPALAILLNVPPTLLMLANTTWSIKKAKNFGFYYTFLMFFVFLLVALLTFARIPISDGMSRRTHFLAFVKALETFLVYGGIIFLELFRCQIISAQYHSIIVKEIRNEDHEEGAAHDWI